MTTVVVGFTVALAVWAAIRGMCRWSDRKVADCQARALRGWEARQCPDRLDDPRDIDLEFLKIVDHWQDTT